MANPYAIIILTTASGAGYGFLALLAFFQAGGLLPAQPILGYAGFPVAGILIVAGVLSPVFHPGLPEGTPRTAQYWRSSWPSREQLMAALTFIPAAVYAINWAVPDWRTDSFTVIGMFAVIFCMQTVYCTAMVYVSNKAVPAWSSTWVLLGFCSLSVMTGALMLNALAAAFGHYNPAFFWVTTSAIVVAGIVKMQYWRSIDTVSAGNGAEPADDPGGHAESPDTSEALDRPILDGKYYRLARAHAAKLRQLSIAAAFAVPILVITLAHVSAGAAIAALAILALIVGLAGVLIERWLFYAEAQSAATPSHDIPTPQ